MKFMLTILFLTFPFFSNGQTTQTICGAASSGWITTAINGNCNGYNISRTVKSLSGLAAGTSLQIVGDPAPAGWVTTSIDGIRTVGGMDYIKKTIKKIEGMAAGSSIGMVGTSAPAEWITTSINGTTTVGGMTYVERTIKKIKGMASGSIVSVCGDLPPAGWITTAVTGVCQNALSMPFIGRTIKKIKGLPVNTTLTVCGDMPPTGWIVTATNGTCATVLNMAYTERRIKKLASTVRMTGGGTNDGDDEDEMDNTASVLAQTDVVISPNPSRTDFKIVLTGYNDNEAVQYRIFDITGKLIANSNVANTNSPIVIGANYQPGLYLLEVTQGDTRKLTKFIKE